MEIRQEEGKLNMTLTTINIKLVELHGVHIYKQITTLK